MKVRLQGKTAVITGGARGLGEAMAKLFAEEGARVIVCDMGEPQYAGEHIEFYQLNVTDAEACGQFTGYAAEKYGKIDILVNNAGIAKDSMTRKMTGEMWDAVIAVNLTGVFNLTRFIGPHMEDTGGGSIINISSVVGEYGNIGQVNYAAAKAGVIGMT
ncbi:MAG: SDR family NAD(P)-dependent oxidoreductase, partial [Treponema sp.]|nr:SDR family NAD(P)-dependent oxidoreductase [Treponema sp.]